MNRPSAGEGERGLRRGKGERGLRRGKGGRVSPEGGFAEGVDAPFGARWVGGRRRVHEPRRSRLTLTMPGRKPLTFALQVDVAPRCGVEVQVIVVAAVAGAEHAAEDVVALLQAVGE